LIFIDTGAFLARYVQRDQYHEQAVQHWRQIQLERRRCFTSNFVLDETFTLLARRTSYTFAALRATHLLQSSTLVILRPDQEDEYTAARHFQKYADQRVSFTDCISFALMEKYHLLHAFTFDQHFILNLHSTWSLCATNRRPENLPPYAS